MNLLFNWQKSVLSMKQATFIFCFLIICTEIFSHAFKWFLLFYKNKYFTVYIVYIYIYLIGIFVLLSSSFFDSYTQLKVRSLTVTRFNVYQCRSHAVCYFPTELHGELQKASETVTSRSPKQGIGVRWLRVICFVNCKVRRVRYLRLRCAAFSITSSSY